VECFYLENDIAESTAGFGGDAFVPVPGDYNGDGTADIGIFLETTGLWAIMGLTRCYFRTMGDVPLTR